MADQKTSSRENSDPSRPSELKDSALDKASGGVGPVDALKPPKPKPFQPVDGFGPVDG